jgi:ELWxxDGT repeat protein
VVLFNGFDAAGKQGLWVTDGTTAGTHEIAVNGAAPGGLNPSDLTAFNHHEVLFNGVDAAGKHSLWETDGTTAGTHEITGIKGANSNGVAPSDLTVLPDGNKLMDAVTSSNQVVGSIPQLVQAMAGFASGGGGADSLNPNPVGADTSKQQFLTTPQHT